MKKTVDDFDELPVGSYNEAHGFLYDEADKDCYCVGGCSMDDVYTEDQINHMLKQCETIYTNSIKNVCSFAEDHVTASVYSGEDVCRMIRQIESALIDNMEEK